MAACAFANPLRKVQRQSTFDRGGSVNLICGNFMASVRTASCAADRRLLQATRSARSHAPIEMAFSRFRERAVRGKGCTLDRVELTAFARQSQVSKFAGRAQRFGDGYGSFQSEQSQT